MRAMLQAIARVMLATHVIVAILIRRSSLFRRHFARLFLPCHDYSSPRFLRCCRAFSHARALRLTIILPLRFAFAMLLRALLIIFVCLFTLYAASEQRGSVV